MPAFHDTAYPRLKSSWTENELNTIFTPTAEEIELAHSLSPNTSLRIVKDDRPVYSWRGHKRSVFRILGDSLYYVAFDPYSTGGRVVAVDLKTSQKVWDSPLKGMGLVQHSAYSNLVNIDANYDVVTVYGNEGAGGYIEIKDGKSGKTVGHKIFFRGNNTQQWEISLGPGLRISIPLRRSS